MKYHLIYQTNDGGETDFELQYINECLFPALTDKELHYDGGHLKTYPKDGISVIIYSTNSLRLKTSVMHYINQFEKPILLHLSNESQNHFAHYYKNAKAVLRSASWNPFSSYVNVFTVPLGFQSGYLNIKSDLFMPRDRPIIWSFAGAIKYDRGEMLNQFASITPNWSYQSTDWGKGMKTTSDLIDIYKNTVFAPTPFGNVNFECFRTMESLEWGCIPVSIEFLGEDCYKYIYGDHPFIIGKDWQDAADKMKLLLEDPIALREKQLEVWQWYTGFKKELAQDVAHIVNGQPEKVRGKQFQYQRQASSNRKLKWRFFKHFTLSVYWDRLLGKAKKSNA